jgi:NAD+ diphosphatase
MMSASAGDATAPGTAAPFRISIPALSRSTADRSEDLRDPDRIMNAWPDAVVLTVDPVGRIAADVSSGPRLRFVPAAPFGDLPPRGAVLLGRLAGVDHWAVATEGEVEPGTVPGESSDPGPSRSLRALGPLLSDADAGFATSAVAMLGWHAAGSFCPHCGQPSTPDLPGHSRTCPNGHQEFPRTDPAVIVLVHDGAGSAVLARQPSWAPGRVSVLAGFVEAGESLEASVVREIREEIGVTVTEVAYLGSQPWPFPRSLMIGFAARVDPGSPLRPREGEIEQAQWFSRQRLRVILAGGEDGEVTLPDPVSIARRMVEGFVAAGES